MIKLLADNTKAEVGILVEVISTKDELSKGDVTLITSIYDVVLNLSGDKIDLSKWPNIVQCNNECLQQTKNLKRYDYT